jgi:PAS domain S-box-containing protein
MPASDATTNLTQQLRALETVPDSYIIISPDLVILTASNAYLADTLKRREDLVGRYLFDAFPDNPATPEAHAVRNWRASLELVLATGEPHQMALQHYDVLDPQRPGHFAERHWLPRNTPVFDEQGQLSYIIHSSVNVTKEVQARQQVRHQQGLLRQIMQQVPAAIATLSGPEHRYSFFNDAYQALSGGRTHLGLPVPEVFPEVVDQGFIDLLDQVYTTGQPFVGTDMPAHLFDVATGQPELHYVDFIYQPLHDAQHHTQGILAFIVDVTDKVWARQQADALQAQLLIAAQHQAAERLAFYQVFEQSPALVALLRAPSHRYEYVNPTYQAFFPGRQLVGQDAAQAVPELQAQGFVALMDRVYQTGETYFGQELPFAPLPIAGQSPRTGYFTFTYQAYREHGEVAGISIFALEVTEQVLARQEREAQRRQLVETFAQAPVAICVFRGPAYVLELVNPPMGVMLGRSPATLMGQPFFAALPELADQGLREVLDQVRQTGTPFVAQERAIYLAHRPQDLGFYNFVYEPLRDEQGQVAAITCVANDVTEQVRARQQVQNLNEELAAINEELTATNEELHESNTQLTRTNVELDTFVYTASHDLKAPITNIEGIVLALRETLPPPVLQQELVRHLLDLLNQTIARFQLTIGQLTDISRLQLAHAGSAEPVVLVTVIDDVRLDLAPAIAAAGTQLTVAVAPELVVSFSPANLRSIVYNLLSNAIKYRDPERPSQVHVHAQQTPHAIQLTVQDNGLGMSEVQQRQLFGLFQRLHTHVEGTGVGLYITKRLVENAGGTLTVESRPHIGTSFTVTFPD